MTTTSNPLATDQKLTFRECVRRANSGFVYWNYRRTHGIPISLAGEVREWFRRFAFEWRINR